MCWRVRCCAAQRLERSFGFVRASGTVAPPAGAPVAVSCPSWLSLKARGYIGFIHPSAVPALALAVAVWVGMCMHLKE